jgi:lysophospholipid hydrolase
MFSFTVQPLILVTDDRTETICILPSTRSVPIAQFAGKLKGALEELGSSCSYLDQGALARHLGKHSFQRIGKLKLNGWLQDHEVRSCSVDLGLLG